jgi:predicted HAD superfamily phosphohydrolase
MQMSRRAKTFSTSVNPGSGSPTGGPVVIGLSASRLARMPATVPESKYLFHIVSEYKPYLFRQRHVDMEVRKEGAGAGTLAVMIVAVIIVVHGHFFSPISSITLSILK